MRTSKVIQIVGCHAEGEVGDVIVGGVAPPPGDTIWAQSRWLMDDETLRNFVLNEPRGGVFRHVNLLVPPKDPAADMGWIIMEPTFNPPMSGSNAMCVATVLVDTGIVPVTGPETVLTLEAPGGLIEARVTVRDGKAERVAVRNHASFAGALDARIEVEGLGTLTVDTAYGGDSFVIVDARALGFEVAPHEAFDLVQAGMKITAAAQEQIGFAHPDNPDWPHISFCQLAMPVAEEDGVLTGRNTVVIQPGKLDRSPTGTGCSARMAVLHARGQLQVGQAFVGRSIIGSRFDCHIESETAVGKGASGKPAIVPVIAGRAWITGTRQEMLDPEDPWPGGYRLSDTWPGAGA